jgi:hypothetical protein
MEYNLAVKREKTLIDAAWVNLKRSQTGKAVYMTAFKECLLCDSL